MFMCSLHGNNKVICALLHVDCVHTMANELSRVALPTPKKYTHVHRHNKLQG